MAHRVLEARRFAPCFPLAVEAKHFASFAHWLLEAKHFAFFCSLAVGSETFRIFRPNNVYNHIVGVEARRFAFCSIPILVWGHKINNGDH